MDSHLVDKAPPSGNKLGRSNIPHPGPGLLAPSTETCPIQPELTRTAVTIVIPAYNNSTTLARAIDSALGQSDCQPEVVVVDDGSTDDTAQVARRYGDRIGFLQQVHGGACKARNLGWRSSKAKFIKFLDADDYLAANCIRDQLIQAQAAPHNTIVFGRGRILRLDGSYVGLSPSKAPGAGQIVELPWLIDSNIMTSCPLHRRELLEEVAGFDEACPRGQEHDLHIRLALHGALFAFHNTVTLYVIQNAQHSRISHTRYQRHVCEMQIAVFEKQAALIAQRLSTSRRDVTDALARQWWRHGRVCTRAGHMDLAQECFRRSRKCANGSAAGIHRSRIYRWLVRALGPVLTEEILLKLRGDPVAKCLGRPMQRT